MLASHDRSGDGKMQFRLEIYPSTKISLMCEGTGGRGGRSDGDGNGYRSELCVGPVPLNQPSRLRITRDHEGRFQMFLNDALASEYHEGPPQDLGIGTISNRAFRIGSRFPPHSGSQAHDSFCGTIREAVLRVAEPAASDLPAWTDPTKGWVLLHSGWIPAHAAKIEPWVAAKGQFTTKSDDPVATYNQVFLDGARDGAGLRRVFILDRQVSTACPFKKGSQSMPGQFTVQNEITFPGDNSVTPFRGPHPEISAWDSGSNSGWQELHQINGGRFIIRKDQVHLCADYQRVGGESNNPRLGRFARVWVRNSTIQPAAGDLPLT